MSFYYKSKTLRGGNTYDSKAWYEMSAREEEVTGEVETDVNGGNEENSVMFSPDLVDERIKESLEPLHAQISALQKWWIAWSKATWPGNSQRQLLANYDINMNCPST